MSFLNNRGWLPQGQFNLLESQCVGWLRRIREHPSAEVIMTALIRVCVRAQEELKADKANKDRPEVTVEDTIKQILKPLANEDNDSAEYVESSSELALKEIAALCVDDTVECLFCDNEDLLTGQHQPKCPIALARRGLRS